MTESTPVLSVRDYALRYSTSGGEIRILDEIGFDIRRGEVLGLVGESGSAKTSLANAIMRDLPGTVAHECGKILLSGRNLMDCDEAAMQGIRGNQIAMVFQNAATALDPTQTLGDHLAETVRRHQGGSKTAANARANELFDLVGLPDPAVMLGRYPHEVSGGEKQRVVFAMALACDPKLILFDEPTSALDATTAATLLDLFRELQQRSGVAALFISHDLGTVATIATRVAVIYGGRIVEDAPAAQLFANPRHPYTRALLASLPRPSDTRSLRKLDVAGARPAPRTGPVPACIYSASCPFHLPAVCDAAPVHLESAGERKVACVRVEDLPPPIVPRGPAPKAPEARLPILQASTMTVTYGSQDWVARLFRRPARITYAVNDANFSLHPGETLGLVGESGCGKSTLARALSGLVPFYGELALDGETVPQINHSYRARVQIVFQNPDSSLNPRHTIGTILRRPLRLYHPNLDSAARDREISAILAKVRLPAEYAGRYPHQLSGGEKQRVAIARALAAKPDVIICDEITSGLDAAVQAAIIQLLRDIQTETGCALILITHDLAILRHIAHRVAVMYLGEIVEVRNMAELDEPPYHPYTEVLMSSSASIDPDAETRRVRLTGTLPTRSARLVGCPFEARCPRRLGEICAMQRPPLRQPTSDHRIFCHIEVAALAAEPPIWRFSNPEKEITL